MESLIAFAVIAIIVALSFHYGKEIGRYEAYDEAFDEVTKMYEEALREEEASA